MRAAQALLVLSCGVLCASHAIAARTHPLPPSPRPAALVVAAARRPVARRRPPDAPAPVSTSLLLANGLVFVLTMRQPRLMRLLAKDDASLRRHAAQWYRCLSACFLHASVPHVLVNSLSLHNLGPAVERSFGPDRTLALYLASGVSGNVLSYAAGRSPVAVGASGAIFGLLGGWAVFLQRNHDFFAARGVDVRSSLTSIARTCALNAALGLPAGARVDNMGHLGGLLGGAACSFLFGPRLRSSRRGVTDQPLVRLPRGPLERSKRKRLRVR
ncbi:hypothetical protein AB1Y20_001758 [Prymnesium parvum]|uniref:Peptidase S54 rhomboid domain-containing protein n=1 Tax=Prymnesium parvum TaxID=97485 RepID=A0AB34K8P2_PRYPA